MKKIFRGCSKYKDNLSFYGTKEYPDYLIANNKYDNSERDYSRSWTLLNRLGNFFKKRQNLNYFYLDIVEIVFHLQ